jgi:hypothetical protein
MLMPTRLQRFGLWVIEYLPYNGRNMVFNLGISQPLQSNAWVEDTPVRESIT